MPTLTSPKTTPGSAPTEALYGSYLQRIHVNTDRLFAALMGLQWVGAVVAALWLSPRTWDGNVSRVHPHVWAALFLGGIITLLPVLLAVTRPGTAVTRHVVAACQMLFSALLIHISGGRIETHFHVFGSLAFLAFYRDWRVLITASAVVALDHILRGTYWPQSVFGVAYASPWRWVEHAAWVVFEDIFLLLATAQSLREVRGAAEHRAQLEAAQTSLREAHDGLERRVEERTAELAQANEVLQEEVVVRQQAEDALQASEQRFRSLVANASDVFAILAPDATLRYVSPAAQSAWGYAPQGLIGTSALSLIHADDLARAQTLLAQTELCAAVNVTGELRLRRQDGTWRICEVIASNRRDDPAVCGVIVTYRDVTERKAFEEQLSHQAFHDGLTGLPNRALFLDRLEHALARGARQEAGTAVAFVDLDNFKVINDSLSHETGDELLVLVAQRLQACARPQDTVARLGGDEFTILLEDLADAQDAIGVIEGIARELRVPLLLQGREVVITASIGVAFSAPAGGADGPGQCPHALLRDADIAMYRAKNGGKASHVVFDRSMNAPATERLELEAELRRAIEGGELRVHYQPIVLLETGEISDIEALVRWEHPRHGLIPPARFIPIAEETGLILPLGMWVLEEACRQTRYWQRQYRSDPPLTVSVNLSIRQFEQANLVAEVVRVLGETGLPATCLKLEITESLMMVNTKAAAEKLHALKALGIQLAVDDFGTGYSSMAYLSSFPLDTLKIDRSFVQRLGQQGEAEAIIGAVMTLAKSLGLQVTGEGIETAAQRTHLEDLGCEKGQGYLFSRPLTAAALMATLAAQQLSRPSSSDASPGLSADERAA